MFTAPIPRALLCSGVAFGEPPANSMIEINDTRLTHYRLRIKRARKAADAAHSDTARQLHLAIAEMYEREIQTLLARALPPR
ncbi:hypothetical protein COO09_14230 [Rhizorhabdus dicambivorans]|uniref:Uncharacterized protein n=1 Tax=Rhizorhabdus dicambivorans TaxID=1850238 RepID=A0A2A4FU61_9SPHN|nr:hypothetical protein [Rhizorhabdus dicambivorans]PCE41669.1 hypothetical protein COO09_14230 [Rhizorhabdus dicambivorans]